MFHPQSQAASAACRFMLALVATLAASFCAATTAGAVNLITQPSADVRPGSSIEDVVALGADNHVYYKSFTGSAWTGWTDLGGGAYPGARPTVISYASNHVDVYVRDVNRRLMHRWWDGSSWRAWEPVGGAWQLKGDPVIVSWAPGRLDAFARGDDNSLIHTYFNGSGWIAWESLGGIITSDPTAISLYPGHLDIYALGTSSLLYHKYFAGGWSGWSQVGSWQYTSRPGISTWNNGSMSVISTFTRGTDGAVDESFWASDSGVWTVDHSQGGYIAGAPAAVSMQYGHIDLFTRSGVDNTLYNKSCCSAGWTGWVQHGTLRMGSDPTGIAWPGHMDVFALDQGGSLIHQAYYNSAWHDWDYLSQPSAPNPTSAQYGGADGSINTTSEARAAVSAILAGGSDANATSIYTGIAPGERALVDQQFNTVIGDRQLVRELNTSSYYYTEDGVLRHFASSSLVTQAELDPGSAKVTTAGGKSSWTTGPEITSASFDDGPGYLAPLDDGTATAAGADWHYKGVGHYDFTSADGAAYAFGYVSWYNGNSLSKVLVRRAYIRDNGVSRVYAAKAVGCIWVQLKFGYPGTSFSVPGPSASISSAETVNNMAVRCRSGSQDRPDPIPLGKQGFAKNMLNSMTIMLCSSATKAAGPTGCSFNKNVYPGA